MGNFGRVLRLTLRYPMTLVTSIVCAIGVAVLWGGNIGAAYPVLQIALNGKSLQEGIVEEIQHSTERIAGFKTEIASLHEQLAHVTVKTKAEAKLKTKIQTAETQLSTEE